MTQYQFTRLLRTIGVEWNIFDGFCVSPNNKRSSIYECHIAQYANYNEDNTTPILFKGAKLKLQRENLKTNAVTLYYDDCKIGYVPKALGKALDELLVNGSKLIAVVSAIQANKPVNQRIKIQILECV